MLIKVSFVQVIMMLMLITMLLDVEHHLEFVKLQVGLAL